MGQVTLGIGHQQDGCSHGAGPGNQGGGDREYRDILFEQRLLLLLIGSGSAPGGAGEDHFDADEQQQDAPRRAQGSQGDAQAGEQDLPGKGKTDQDGGGDQGATDGHGAAVLQGCIAGQCGKNGSHVQRAYSGEKSRQRQGRGFHHPAVPRSKGWSAIASSRQLARAGASLSMPL